MPSEKTLPRGKVWRAFIMQCGVCQQKETLQYPDGGGSFDGAIEHFCNTGWKVTDNFGYVHKSCVKYIPALIKFK